MAKVKWLVPVLRRLGRCRRRQVPMPGGSLRWRSSRPPPCLFPVSLCMSRLCSLSRLAGEGGLWHRVPKSPVFFSLQPYKAHKVAFVGRSLWCLDCYEVPGSAHRSWRHGRCGGVRPPFDHATSSEGWHTSASGCVPGAPSWHGGPVVRAGWSSGASMGEAGWRPNIFQNRTRRSRRMFGAASPAPMRTPCGCCMGLWILGI